MVILKRLALDTSALKTNRKSGSVCSKAVVIQSTNLYVNTVIITNVPGVFDRVLEVLVFWICLLRGAALRKKHICTYANCFQLCHFQSHGIHDTANDVTKGLIGLC